MAAPPAYLDEDVPAEVAPALRARGFTVLTTAEAGALTASGDAQLVRAATLGYVLVSHNRWHFRRLHERFLRADRHHAGIALLPQDANSERLVTRLALMLDWLGTQERSSHLWQWHDCQQALLRGLRLRGYEERDILLALRRS